MGISKRFYIFIILFLTLLEMMFPVFSRQEAENFSDSFFPEKMFELKVPGAVVIFLSENGIFFSGSYGYSDLESKKPMNIEETLFPVGSISKLIVTLSILKLESEGLLKLDEDINKYLKTIQLSYPFGKPVTLAQLLTHTSGLDDFYLGSIVKTESLSANSNYIKDRIPEAVFPPGERVRYSTHAFEIAAIVIEDLTGISFEEYAKENFLSPLKMNSSTFEQNSSLFQRVAEGYNLTGNILQHLDPDKFRMQVNSSGGLISSALDLARLLSFLIGTDPEIITDLQKEKMFEKQFSMNENLPGFCYGFYEKFLFGKKVFNHGGEMFGYNSQITIFPEEKLAVIISYNESNSRMRNEFLQEFAEVLNYPKYPYIPEEPLIKKNMADFQGIYKDIRYTRNEVDKIVTLTQPYTVKIEDYGTALIKVSFPYNFYHEDSFWQRVSENSFRNITDGSFLVFERDFKGKVSFMYFEERNFVKCPPWENLSFQIIFLVISVILSFFCFKALKTGIFTILLFIPFLFLLNYGAHIFSFFLLHDVWEICLGVPLSISFPASLARFGVILTTLSLSAGIFFVINRRKPLKTSVYYLLSASGQIFIYIFLFYWSMI